MVTKALVRRRIYTASFMNSIKEINTDFGEGKTVITYDQDAYVNAWEKTKQWRQ